MPDVKYLLSLGWLLGLILIWDLIWRGLALWKAGRHNQKIWFIFLLILNSLGILPVVYLLFFQKDRANA
jgi:hypothetical protein